jgi:cytochrome c biogenesis protein ResB
MTILKNILSRLPSTGFFIFVLSLCGLVLLGGIIIPQNAGAEEYARVFGNAFSKVIIWCGWDDIYSSLWFILPIAVLSINLLSCLTKRLVSIIQALRLGKTGISVAAGSLLLHAGILILLAGAAVQHFSGDKQEVFIVEGTLARMEEFNVNILLRSFSIIRNAKNEIVNYRSDLEIRDPYNRPCLDGASMVNSPLKYRNLYLYQMTYGRVPNAVRDFRAVIADPNGDTIFKGIIPYQVTHPLGKSGLDVRCTDFLCDFYYDPEKRMPLTRSHDHNNPAFKIILYRNGKPIDSQWLFHGFPLKNGKFGPYSASVLSYTPLFYSGILVQRKPGTPYVLTGIIAVSIGLMVTFLRQLQRRNGNG